MAQQAETVSERFALRVDEIERECVISLASRLAQRNGEVRLRSFCTHLSLPIKQLRLGEEGCLRALSKLADLDLEQLWAGTPRQSETGYFDLGREWIKFSAFLRATMRVCPLCVQETGMHQKGIWQPSQIRVCPDHGCLLQSLPRPKLADDQLDVATCARQEPLGPCVAVSKDLLGPCQVVLAVFRGQGLVMLNLSKL